MSSWNDFWDSPKNEGWKFATPGLNVAYGAYRGWKSLFGKKPDKFHAESIQPTVDLYNQAKQTASNIAVGRGVLGSRGANSRIQSQGLGGIPGIQSAVETPARYRTNERLMDVNSKLDMRRADDLKQVQRLNVAMKMMKDEKDEAKKARWSQIIQKLVGTGVGFLLGGPAGAAAGTQVTSMSETGQFEGGNWNDPQGGRYA